MRLTYEQGTELIYIALQQKCIASAAEICRLLQDALYSGEDMCLPKHHVNAWKHELKEIRKTHPDMDWPVCKY